MGHADQVGNLLMKSKYMRHLNCSICAGSLGGWEVDEYHIQTDVLQHVRAFNVCRLWRFQPKVTHRKTDVQLSTGRRVLEGARFDLEVETQHFILCFVLFPAQKDMLLSNQKGSKRLSHVIHAAMLIFQISECNQWETCRTQLNCTEAVMLMSTHSLNDTDAPSHSLVTPFLLPRPSPESIQQLPLCLASDGEQKVLQVHRRCHLSLQRFKSLLSTEKCTWNLANSPFLLPHT